MNNPNDQKPGQIVEEEVIPIVEERVHLEKRVREGRTVSVRAHTVAETVRLAAPFARERVTIERVPVDRQVNGVPPMRTEGDLTIIPVVEERPRIVMDLVLIEEIHLRRTREEGENEIEVERRRTEIDVTD